MIEEGKFGVQEAVCLVTITISTKLFFTSPAFLSRFVGTAVWYTTLVSAAASIAAFALICLLLKRFPGKNIVEIFDASSGRFFGFIFSFLLAFLFLMDAGIFMREFIDILRTYTYEETPSGLMTAFLIVIVASAAFLGLESIARVSKLFAYFLLISYIAVIVLAAKDYHIEYIFPILGYGLDKTIAHGLRRSSVYGEVITLAVFAGSLQGLKHIKKVGYISLILSAVILSAGLLGFLMTFSYSSLPELTSPMYTMSRLIKYGSFFTRLDTLLLLLWNVSSFITLSVLFYSAVSVYCKIFRLKDARPVIIPMAVVLFASAIAPRDFTDIVYGFIQKFREYNWAVFYGLPIISLILAMIRGKKGDVPNA